MAYETIYNDTEGGVITVYTGSITDEDVIRSSMAKSSLVEKLKSYSYAITDLSEVEKFAMTSEGIQDNVEIISKIFKANPEILVALVVPRNVEYGMARMWQAYADKYDIKSYVARTREEAEKWVRENL